MDRGGRPWGKLVKVDSSETVLLFSRECTVGRKKGKSLSEFFVSDNSKNEEMKKKKKKSNVLF